MPQKSPYNCLPACTICKNKHLEQLVDLPRFPFTGMYWKEGLALHDFIHQGVDQGLMYCPECGHCQLRNVVDPTLVYDDTYTHRGSTSPIAKQGNEFFARFLENLFPGKTFQRILDIGCNDGYLLQQLAHKGQHLWGIDPIWIGKDHQPSEKISILGGFIEKVNLKQALGGLPDLVVSAHTFEHIENPRHVLETILSQVNEGTIVVIEVPSLDTLVHNHRFDQVFHQHIQYFNLASFDRLIKELGCTYLAHTFNYSMWGGTMLMAFQKKLPCAQTGFKKKTNEEIKNSFKLFLSSLDRLSDTLSASPSEKIYGFGAAQMLPSLAYHCPSQLHQIKEILDDNVQRQGTKYPMFHFNITSPEGVNLEDADVVITALDSTRPIFERLARLKAKRILMPIHVA